MKDLFNRYQDKLTPGEDARVWSAAREARAGKSRPIRWRLPAALGAVATAVVAITVLQQMGTDPVSESLKPDLPQAVDRNEVSQTEQTEELRVDEMERDTRLNDAPGEAAAPVQSAAKLGAGGKDEDLGASGAQVSEEVTRPDKETPQKVEVLGNKKVIEHDTSASFHTVTPEELGKLPADNFEDAVALKSGVVEQGQNLNFRGGRSGEVKYKVDGVPVPDSRVKSKDQTAVGMTLEKAPTGPMIYPGTPQSGGQPLSTGGTDPVNGEAYDAMFFKNYGVNPFVATEDDRFSTFAMDVDNASYTLVRSYLERGHVPPAEAVRVEEIINAFDHNYPAPYGDLLTDAEGTASELGTFAIYLDAGPSPFHGKNNLMRVGLKGREVRDHERKPAVLTFVVDVSGSMQQENRLSLVKRSLHHLLNNLKATDRVGLVVYGTNARTLLPSTSLSQRWVIEQAIDALQPEGATNAEAGLQEAYRLAGTAFEPRATNRVILCSDGVANVGTTGADGILKRIESEASRGIELTTIGFGMGNYNDVLMEQLANRGDGSYFYVDRFAEASRIFGRDLTGTLETIAKDAKIQVEFLPDAVDRYRLLGYENRDVADKDFRNDAVDAGEVGAGHEVTALFEMRLMDNVHPESAVAVVRIRYEDPRLKRVVEESRVLKAKQIAANWHDAGGSLQMDAALAAFGEQMRGSFWAKDMDPAVPVTLAAEASGRITESRRSQAAEVQSLMQRYMSLVSQDGSQR